MRKNRITAIFISVILSILISCSDNSSIFLNDHKPDVMWSKIYRQSTHNSLLYSMVQVNSNKFFSIGQIYGDHSNLSGGNGWINVFDNSGKVLDSIIYGGSGEDYFHTILRVRDNYYFVIGSSDSDNYDLSENNGFLDGWILAVDNNAEKIWSKCYGTEFNDYVLSISKTNNGNYIVSGEINSYELIVQNSINMGWMFKIDDSGNLLWSKSFSEDTVKRIFGAFEKKDGNIVSIGQTSNDSDKYLIWSLHDPEGNIIESKKIASMKLINVTKVISTKDNKLMLIGRIVTNEDEGGLVMKIDYDGNILWKRSYMQYGACCFCGISPFLIDDSYIVSGGSTSLEKDFDDGYLNSNGIIFRIDGSGKIIWNKQFTGPDNMNSTLLSTFISNDFKLFSCGTSNLKDNTFLHNGWILKMK